MTFSISALILARDSHIKPDSEAGGLIWVEGWYQWRYGKFHVIIFLSHTGILHWPFPSIDFYIAKKIFELTNCENKSLRELPLFNFESGFKNLHKTLTFEWKVLFNTVVKELRSKMFGQHPGYFKAVFLKQTRIIIVSIYKYTVYIMFWIMMLYDCYYY